MRIYRLWKEPFDELRVCLGEVENSWTGELAAFAAHAFDFQMAEGRLPSSRAIFSRRSSLSTLKFATTDFSRQFSTSSTSTSRLFMPASPPARNRSRHGVRVATVTRCLRDVASRSAPRRNSITTDILRFADHLQPPADNPGACSVAVCCQYAIKALSQQPAATCKVDCARAIIDNQPVTPLLLSLIAAARGFFRSRTDIVLEIVALRQQIAVLKRKRPQPRLPLTPIIVFARLSLYLITAEQPRIEARPGRVLPNEKLHLRFRGNRHACAPYRQRRRPKR